MPSESRICRNCRSVRLRGEALSAAGSLALAPAPRPARLAPVPVEIDEVDEPDELVAEAEADLPAAELEAPPNALDLTDGRSPVEHFEHLLIELRREDSFLASEIEQAARLLHLDRSELALAVPLHALDAMQPGIGRLERVARRLLEPTTRVTLHPFPDDDDRLAGETLYARRQRMAAETRERRRGAAARDPVVCAALRVFGTELTDINPR